MPVTTGPTTKFQEKVKGGVPPITVAVNVTLWPTVGDVGLKLKSTPDIGAWTADSVTRGVTTSGRYGLVEYEVGVWAKMPK